MTEQQIVNGVKNGDRKAMHEMYDLLANGTGVEDINAIDPQIIMSSNLSLF